MILRALGQVLLAVVLLGLPQAAAQPAQVSLTALHAEAVDFADGVVWFLAIGSDAQTDEFVMHGNADALQLIGVDFATNTAVMVGIPRDTWLEVEGHEMRINETLARGRHELVARTVDELVGIRADYVVVASLDGFTGLVDAIGGVTVWSKEKFNDPEHPLPVRRGMNRFDGVGATTFARARKDLDGGDFARSANHQELIKGIVRELQAHEDDEGFMEVGVYAALGLLDTNLPPTELYRLAQAVTQIELRRVTSCVLPGTDYTTPGGGAVILVNKTRAHRVGDDIREDVTLDRPC